jgi:H+-transporting ATPase
VHIIFRYVYISFILSSDTCILEAFDHANTIDEKITIQSCIPFDPISKRVEVTYQDKSNLSIHRVTKGMPEVIVRLCANDQIDSFEENKKVRSDVNEFARRGLRALAVAIANDHENFKLIGLLPIIDPPRADTAETIKKALELGIFISSFFLQ